MSFDSIPLWAVLLLTVSVVLVSLEIGARLGRWTLRRGGTKLDISAAMVGATMGLIAFMMAFTFNSAAGRHDTRKALVIEEANAIETTWLRAGFLPEPHRSEARQLLREYVDVRAGVATGIPDINAALQRSEQLQERLWNTAIDGSAASTNAISAALFVESLNQVIDLNLRRVTVGLRNRVAPTIWVTLYVLLAAGMVMIGTQVGLSGARHIGTEAALAISFSLVLFLIADLDRPQHGLITVSQQAMQELQVKLHAR